jgi:hypothetical protein
MLIITTPDSQPEDFRLLAQNMKTYALCGHSDAEGYETVDDIPPGFAQRALPPQYGEHLTLAQINNGLLLENGELKSLVRQVTDAQLAIVELYEGGTIHG